MGKSRHVLKRFEKLFINGGYRKLAKTLLGGKSWRIVRPRGRMFTFQRRYYRWLNGINSIGFYRVRNARTDHVTTTSSSGEMVRGGGWRARSLRFDVYEKGYNGQKALIQRVRAPLGLLRRNEWGAYGDIYLTAALSWRPAAMYFEDAILP